MGDRDSDSDHHHCAAAAAHHADEIDAEDAAHPAAGCLPLLIQFPFLIAYYRMLGVALELRHAHWLWITDLSASDWVLPILMVVSMVVMQRMTPQTGMDP